MPPPTPSPAASRPDSPRAHVEAWTRSGLTAAAYAARHGLKASTLYGWRRRLRRVAANAPDRAPRLVPVTLEAPALAELVLRDGAVLRVPLTVEPARLAALARALEAR
jgi:transposase-like protein